jgi:vitamin B12 transporter
VDSGSVSLLAAWKKITGSFAGYFTGQRTDSDFLFLFLPPHTPGYVRFDFSANYEIRRGVSAYTRVQNIFDRQYQDALGFPALGREVRVGMNYRFGGKS